MTATGAPAHANAKTLILELSVAGPSRLVLTIAESTEHPFEHFVDEFALGALGALGASGGAVGAR